MSAHERNAANHPRLSRLYEAAFPATRTGPLYNAFSYPTKISAEAVAVFVAAHVPPGGSVLDVFAGSGSTGLGAKLCDRPTRAMVDWTQRLGLEVEWGPRHAHLYDVSVMGTTLARAMCAPPDTRRFAEAAHALVDRAVASTEWLYAATNDGVEGRIRHVIWSEVVRCVECGTPTSFWEAAVRLDPLRLEPLRLDPTFPCPGCGLVVAIDECSRELESYFDPVLGEVRERRRRVPVRVFGRSGARNWEREVTPEDLARSERAAGEQLPPTAPVAPLTWGDLYRAGYHHGISHLHHLYTPRNFFALAVLWNLIDEFDSDLRDALRVLVLSFNASHSTLMTRVVVKQNQRNFILTGAQSGVMYVSGLPVEKNVFEGVRRKISTFSAAFDLVAESRSSVAVHTASSASLELADESIDYVFTDPPFGDYIPYAEINQVNELWLGATTDRAQETIISSAQGKDVRRYGDEMARTFAEIARVLKPDGLATVVFHSAKADVWRALIEAYEGAGLGVRTTSVLDKTQASFKQVVSTTTVRGDPLILLDKAARGARGQKPTIEELVAVVLSDAIPHVAPDEKTKERLYSRFITRCLVEDVPVTLGAADFYAAAGLAA